MKRLQKIIYALSAVSLVLCLGTEARAQPAVEYAENQVIVKMRRGAPMGAVESLHRELNSRVMKRLRIIDAELWEISGLTVEEAIEIYSRDPRIVYIEPNYIVYADEVIPDEPNFGLLWGLQTRGNQAERPMRISMRRRRGRLPRGTT